MLEKIDKTLLSDIRICSGEDTRSCVIMFDSADSANDYIKTIGRDVDTEYFSCIRSVAVEMKLNSIYSVARSENVVYISSTPKVCTMVNVAKKIIGIDDTITSAKFAVAIIDTGLYPHVDFLLDRNNRISFIDQIASKNNIYDDNGHGTMVASLLTGSGIVSGKKYSGVDKNNDIVIIKALDQNGETNALNILRAMQWIYDNASEYNIKVVCMSFGSNVLERNDPMIAGVDALWDKGIVVVTACGNSGPTPETIKSPSASKKVISVGAMDDMRVGDNYNEDRFSVADFSSRGPILGYYKPDLIVSGVEVMAASNFGITGKFYDRFSGTSVATPIVAGVVCRLLKKYPMHTPDQIKNILINNCRPITGDRNSEGYGWLDLHTLLQTHGL